MYIDVIRSPGKIGWHVLFVAGEHRTVLAVESTRKAGIQLADELANKYGLDLSTSVLDKVKVAA